MDPLDDRDEMEPSPEQMQTLVELGVSERELEGLTFAEAQELIESLEAAREPRDHAR